MGGDLLASSGGDQSDKLVGAIVLNIWSSYQKTSDQLTCLLVDCEEARIAVMKVSKFLVCVYGDHNAEFGMLKAKVEALEQFLQEPLQQLVSDSGIMAS